MKKALVFDLDDTLLNRQKKVSSQNKNSILEAISKGVSVYIATSRPIRAIRSFVDSDLLEKCTTISLNGAISHDSNNIPIQYSFIDPKAVAKVLQNKKILESGTLTFELDGITFSTNKEYSDKNLLLEQSALRELLIPLHNFNPNKISKISIDGNQQNLDHLRPTIESYGLNPIFCMNDTFINVLDPRTDKSSTLNSIFEQKNISWQQAIVFGDDLPDRQMMILAGTSVAMDNAHNKIKELANTIIGDCDSHSISDYISSNILSE